MEGVDIKVIKKLTRHEIPIKKFGGRNTSYNSVLNIIILLFYRSMAK